MVGPFRLTVDSAPSSVSLSSMAATIGLEMALRLLEPGAYSPGPPGGREQGRCDRAVATAGRIYVAALLSSAPALAGGPAGTREGLHSPRIAATI